MKIVADRNIPFVQQAFASMGEVQLCDGRALDQAQLTDCELLLVRSVSRVTAQLLADTPVRFVGTATIGTDHVDLPYLQSKGIGFASAPGCNAVSAAEYVIAALLHLSMQQGFALAEKTVGIIGYGNVGSRVVKRLQALGVKCLVNDPPRAAVHGDVAYVGLEELRAADVLSIHVPLVEGGAHPTRDLLGDEFFQGLKPGSIFVNTSRGDVINEAALCQVLGNRDDLTLVLDVWQNEPTISPWLMHRAAIATPHIAGYSLDGKVRGTQMLYDAVCHHFSIAPVWKASGLAEARTAQRFTVSSDWLEREVIARVVRYAYDIQQDDSRLRQLDALPDAEHGQYFDRLRREYPVRREFDYFQVQLPPTYQSYRNVFSALGFQVQTGE